MSDKYISSLHIQKLGHEILEIRERALSNLISKLDHGFVYDNDLARSNEILTKLLEWFLHEPCTKQEQVFSLIKRILTSQSGKSLIVHNGASKFREQIRKIRSYVPLQYHSKIDEILTILNEIQCNNIVPPLESDLPLSYRSGQSTRRENIVGTTATTISGYVQQDASASQRTGYAKKPTITETTRTENTSHLNSSKCLINTLKWQHLIETDRHVLQSIETNIRRPPEPSSLLHSADFFNNVLLQDFPAEIFLQRPFIVLSFIDLINKCPSTRIVNAILNCLENFIRALQVRINHHNDPAIYNNREINGKSLNSRSSTPDSTSRRTDASGQSDDDTASNGQSLKSLQVTFPRFCHNTYKAIFKFLCKKQENNSNRTRKRANFIKGFNLAFSLLHQLINLLALILNKEIWSEQSVCAEVQEQMNEILIGYGVILEHFRLEAGSDDSNLTNRIFQLCALESCAYFLQKFIPLEQSGLLLPRNLKTALANSLVDVALAKLYPNVHKTLLDYVESFSIGIESDSFHKYKETNRICQSMASCIEFMNNHSTDKIGESLKLIKKALPCLELHQNFRFIKDVINLAADKLHQVHDNDVLNDCEEVLLKLLAHNTENVQEEVYRLCQKKVVNSIGPLLTSLNPGEDILFLINPKVFVEIASYGVLHENRNIRSYAEDILIYILKSKILISPPIWNRIVQCLIIAMPVLLCHLNRKTTSLAKTLMNTFDPDAAKAFEIPKIVVIKANIHTLFCLNGELREESFSRLCWMLSSQKDSRELLPRLNNLHDKALPNVAHTQRIVEVNRGHNTEHFYQPSSLQQVLELLSAPNVEPVIRRSALTQINVMLDDPLLHSTFIDRNGIELVLNVMEQALREQNYKDYPDSIIPAIGILKNICLYHLRTRQELGANVNLLFNTLRGLFLFFTEEKLKQDAVTLLFLLICQDYVEGSPSKGNISVPYLIEQSLRVPFVCHTHAEISRYYEQKIWDIVKEDRWCLSSLQIQWNCEMFGGFDNLLEWNGVDFEDSLIVDKLKISKYDLECLKASSIDYCIKKYLIKVQNAVSHEEVVDYVNKLISYLHLYKFNPSKTTSILNHQWEVTFVRFLKSLPSGEADAQLLSSVLNLLKLLVPFYNNSETPLWLIKMLKNSSICLTDLIALEAETNDELKSLSRNILSLITACVVNEQHFLDFSQIGYLTSNEKIEENLGENWSNIIEIIANCLKFNDSTHFYNLAYLDSLLSCLAHLTASLGWTKTHTLISTRKLLSQLVASLCELIIVFHCGKGSTAAISVMGLSITRHVVLILNHLIAEMHYRKLKNWEDCFLDFDDEDWMKSFMILWSSRDVVLRAGALQLFAGLSKSPRLAINIVNELKSEKGDEGTIWQSALNLVINPNEACIVRENAAMLLAHLTNHTSLDNANGIARIHTSLVPKIVKKDKSDAQAVFDMFEENHFFHTLALTLDCLYTNRLIDFDKKIHAYQWSSSEDDDLSSKSSTIHSNHQSISTPALVKNFTLLLNNLHKLDMNRLCLRMQDNGLTKLIFRCICNPNMSIEDTKKLSLYCEILEMNIGICLLTTNLVRSNAICLGTILHTKDCLNVLISLLNKQNYHTHLPQLVYLRNRLWSEVFQLLATLINTQDEKSQDALIIISDVVNESGGNNFIQVFCEALSCFSSDDLQNSALHSLSTLLKIESHNPESSSAKSFTNLLDSQFSPHQNNEESLIAGSEICKILLNLYELSNLQASKQIVKKKSLIFNALSTILAVSQEAKRFAFECGLTDLLMKQLKDLSTKLSFESIDSLRKVSEKKRLQPILKELIDLIGLITNYLVGNGEIKEKFAQMGLCDLIHKLWVWFLAQKTCLIDVLKLLATFTANSHFSCQSMTFTSAVAGSGPRKTPTRLSLLHAIVSLIEKEMDLVSKTHNLNLLETSFKILTNCCNVIECRALLAKSTLLSNSMSRLHPALTKKQKQWEHVELMWLEFLQIFSLHAEGQSSIAKINDVFELVLTLAMNNAKQSVRLISMLVLRNIAFYQPNRSRLLTCEDFLNVLQTKLDSGSAEEKSCCILIMWSLGANNQKAKIVFKSAQLDARLEQILKHYELRESSRVDWEEVERTKYVLNMIRDDKSK